MTLTLNGDQVEELRRLVGARSLSAAVDSAVAAYLTRIRHLAAVDDWLVELEREHGPVPTETLEWAAQLVEQWDAAKSRIEASGGLMLLLDSEALSAIAHGPARRRDRVRALILEMRRRELPVGTVAAVLAEVVRGRLCDAGVFAGLRRERVEVAPVDSASVSVLASSSVRLGRGRSTRWTRSLSQLPTLPAARSSQLSTFATWTASRRTPPTS